MDALGIVILFGVGFIVGRNWKKVRDFVQPAPEKKKRKSKVKK
jgi:hypothetical protein